MSKAATKDLLRKACDRVGRMKEPDWSLFQLRSDGWDGVSRIMVKTLDELKGHGVTKPLGKLQELAFDEALAKPADRPLQTVALWLTDSRIWLDRYLATKSDGLRALMEHRGLMKPRGSR